MAASVILGIWNSNQFQRIKIENVDLENKVEILKIQAIKLLNNSTNIGKIYVSTVRLSY